MHQPYSLENDYVVQNGVLTKCLRNSIKYAEIPFGVEKIGDNAFRSCTEMESVTIPVTVREIGKNAFEGCTSLKRVDIPDSVQKMGSDVFADCKKLTFVRLPSGLQQIQIEEGNELLCNA